MSSRTHARVEGVEARTEKGGVEGVHEDSVVEIARGQTDGKAELVIQPNQSGSLEGATTARLSKEELGQLIKELEERHRRMD